MSATTTRLPGKFFVDPAEKPQFFTGSEPSNSALRRKRHGRPVREPRPALTLKKGTSPNIPGMRLFEQDGSIHVRFWLDKGKIEAEGKKLPKVGDQFGRTNNPIFEVTKLNPKTTRESDGDKIDLVEVYGVIAG